MKRKLFTRLTAGILLLIMTLTACAGPGPGDSTTSGASPVPADNEAENLTTGQLADYFMKAADDYHPGTGRAVVLEGFTGSEQATRLQMFVLAGRAFGELPVPTGNGRNTAPPAVDLTDAPEWSWSVLRSLSNGGVLAASDLDLNILVMTSETTSETSEFEPLSASAPKAADQDTPSADKEGTTAAPSTDMADSVEADPARLSDTMVSASEDNSGNDKMNAAVTQKDAEILAQRFFQAFGTNLKDNFYTTVNKSEMDALKIPADGSAAGGSSAVTSATNRQVHDLILEIVNSGRDYPQGSSEQKIRDFYMSILALEQRNAAGIEPLRKYLDAVDAAQNFSGLNAAIAQTVRELGNLGNGLFPMVAVTDTQDSSRKVMQLMTLTPMFSQEDYADSDNEMIKEYRASMVDQLVAAGESQAEAERLADGILRMEKDLAENASSPEELSSLLSQTNRYTPESLDQLMPEAKPSELIHAIGLKSDFLMEVFDDKQFAAFAAWFTEENLDLFQALQKIALITGYSRSLSQELAENHGYQGDDYEEAANEAVQSYLSDELGQLYVERYFPAESKSEIEEMVHLLTEAFKTRIGRLDWMDQTTKQEAIKKLDSLTVLIGYPDKWNFNSAEIRGVYDGGSYFSNMAASEADKWQNMVKGLDEPIDPRRFPMAAFTVNAAASRNTNTLIFPAGILQSPLYDQNASFEANLGAIGSTIAHEITHLFDDGGAQYDATGTVRNWWTDEDYTHFQELCQKAETFYNGYEAAPGIPTDGKETLSENIADIGGIACGLEILSSRQNPDYDAFFRSYARYWIKVAGYDTLSELAQTDQHAPNILRANRVLSNFQEFFDTYGIVPGDGMYVAPEDRIVIW
ncbi:M13-type metalloendopeptidase [Diplocloster modestus]|uniref:M13 family metallopeptidase n=1 Tax=Diplocloster modestus TaxID=2850322 RepID=A0ABS6KEL9_9FIRM|nr:M13 family metallopeptidase [Diplocloster modestus]MBU9728967.1 M13 family metallopeptidase [Diplocloster modestus]